MAINKKIEELEVLANRFSKVLQELKKDVTTEENLMSNTSTKNYIENNITNNNYWNTNKIVEIKTLDEMIWINVDRKTGKDSYLGKCIKFKNQCLKHNRKALLALGLIDPEEKPSNSEIESILIENTDYLIGKEIQYSITTDGKYIYEIIGVVN